MNLNKFDAKNLFNILCFNVCVLSLAFGEIPKHPKE